jgi:hypothetical protein
MDWDTIWANSSQTHLVALTYVHAEKINLLFKNENIFVRTAAPPCPHILLARALELEPMSNCLEAIALKKHTLVSKTNTAKKLDPRGKH